MEPEKLDELLRGKNINFLVGSGASVPMYPSLSFGNNFPTFEDISSHINALEDTKTFMYVYYFIKWIEPMAVSRDEFYSNYSEDTVFINYKRLIHCFSDFLQSESNEVPKRINIFTTNYDLLFERAFDDFLFNNPLIYFNDGSRGVFKKYISNKNFYLNVTHSGYNDNYRREVPTINLFKLHGSLSWELSESRILVSERTDKISIIKKNVEKLRLNKDIVETIITESKSEDSSEFVEKLNAAVQKLKLDQNLLTSFFKEYSKLPIVNPNKYKFFETVSEQHYYQLIRSFSYELERKQTVLFVFGFSFADEHIKDIFERSLLNPELVVIIISYSRDEQAKLKNLFKGYKNIQFLPKDFNGEKGDFDYLLSILGDTNVE